MEFFVTQMTVNRAYSKARTRLNDHFERLKNAFRNLATGGEPFDDVIVAFVDEDEDFYKEVKNKNRVYQVNIGLPSGDFKGMIRPC